MKRFENDMKHDAMVWIIWSCVSIACVAIIVFVVVVDYNDGKAPTTTQCAYENLGGCVEMLDPNNADVICAAYLHDTLEDTDTTYDELVKEFGPRVAELVYEVTQEGSKDNYGYYFPRLKSKDAILIKFADRASNIARMDAWPESRKEQYLNKSKFWRSEGPNE